MKRSGLDHTFDKNLFFHTVTGIDVASACATRKVLLEQLGRVLPSDVDTLPDKVFLANTADHYGARMAEKLSDNGGFKVRPTTFEFSIQFIFRSQMHVQQKYLNL